MTTLPVPHEMPKSQSVHETVEHLIQTLDFPRIVEHVDSVVRGATALNHAGQCVEDVCLALERYLDADKSGDGAVRHAVAYDVLAAAIMLVCAHEAMASVDHLIKAAIRAGFLEEVVT